MQPKWAAFIIYFGSTAMLLPINICLFEIVSLILPQNIVHMYRNILFRDYLHLVFWLPRYVDLIWLLRSKSFLMVDNDGIKGYMLLKKEKLKLQNSNNSNETLHFLRAYNHTDFDTYQIISLFQKEDDGIIYNILDRVLGKLNNGDYLWGKAYNSSDHYLYQKLGFIKLSDNIYGYQYTL
jgi:hypothetical protein